MAILDKLKKYFKMLPPQAVVVNLKAAQIADMIYKSAIENNLFADNEKFNCGYDHRLEKYILYYDIGRCDTACCDIKINHTVLETEMQANRRYMSILEEVFAGAKITPEEQICKEILYYAIDRNEQFDGMGFPKCLKGNGISPLGRILCVADYMAREFIDGAHKDDLIKNLKLRLGKRFDPEVVSLAIGVTEQLYQQERDLLPAQSDEFRSVQMLYQPVCDATGNKVKENSGLICLNDPTRGVLKPSFYTAIAERNGRIMDITKYGLELLFADMASSKLGNSEMSRNFSVGVSVECLTKPSFFLFVKRLIREFAVNPQRLTFDIDASAVNTNDGKLSDCLQWYRDLGIRLALDNYGVDNASLFKLQDMEFDVIKIDRSFIDKICDNQKTYEIVKNIIKMADDLNISVVAKGVDNEQQRAFLLDLKCLYMQGRLFGEAEYFSI